MYEPRSTILRRVLHHYPEPFRTYRKIHRTANGRRRVAFGCRPVGDVPVLSDLERTQDAKIEVVAAYHCETVSVVKKRASESQCGILFPRINEPRIDSFGPRSRPQPEYAILRVKDYFAVRWDVVANQCRNSYAEVDVPTLRNILRNATSHLAAAEGFHIR